MAFIPLKNFLSIRHFKLIGLIGPKAVGERVNFGCMTYGGPWVRGLILAV
jgi:hypothetical protein